MQSHLGLVPPLISGPLLTLQLLVEPTDLAHFARWPVMPSAAASGVRERHSHGSQPVVRSFSYD